MWTHFEEGEEIDIQLVIVRNLELEAKRAELDKEIDFILKSWG